MAGVNNKLRIFSDTYSEQKYSNIERLSKAMLTKADQLSPYVTRLYGNMSNWFPLMLQTEGRGRIRKVESSNMEFQFPVIGKPIKSQVVAKTDYSAGDKPGVGRTAFDVYFRHRIFGRDQDLETPSGLVAKIIDDPQPEGDYWRFRMKLQETTNNSQFVPISDLQPGEKWTKRASAVGLYGSRGNESHSQAPSFVKNQLTHVRSSFNLEGNIDNKVMTVQIPTDKGPVQYYTEWELYLHDLHYRLNCEEHLWYSRYNRDANGKIVDVDINSGAPIPRGAGVLQQIPNKTTYSDLSEKKIKKTIRDVFYNSNALAEKNIEIYTGTGGMEAFHEAFAANGGALEAIGLQATSDKFYEKRSGGKDGLIFGNYFKAYQHIDGHTITIRHLPLLDHGSRAEKAPLHPRTQLPITSYDMYFLDMSETEKGPNISFLAEKGRENYQKVVPGIQAPKGYDTDFASSDVDRSSIEFGKTIGVHVEVPTNCFIMENSMA